MTMNAMLARVLRSFGTILLLGIVNGASAQAPVKIGLIGEFTGPFADYGTQIYNGIKAYLKQNGDVFGGRKIEFIVKDTTGAVPDRAKRLAVDAVTQDGVDILAGFGLTPNAPATRIRRRSSCSFRPVAKRFRSSAATKNAVSRKPASRSLRPAI